MQTFVTSADPVKIAQDLDWRRLNKQITESLQIIRSSLYGTGWKHHPAVKMWKGHEHHLAVYDRHMIVEWWQRGYVSHQGSVGQVEEFIATLPDTGWPSWWGNAEMIRTHQSNLIRKDAEHYQPLFPGVPNDIEYFWP